MKKVYILVVFLLLATLGYMNFLNHKFSYKAWNTLLGKAYSGNDYVSFYFNSFSQPLYLREDTALLSYMKQCHQNKKNCIFVPFQQSLADGIWMWSIQYVWESLAKFKARGLYGYLQNLTTFSPYWVGPYEFGQLLLPISDTYRKSISTKADIQLSYKQAIQIGEKGINFNCDKKKISDIINLSNEEFIKAVTTKNALWEQLKNPCRSYRIPYLHAFNWFYYLKDADQAYKYYKISAFNEDAPKAALNMAGVVQSRLWYHDKALNLWFDRFISFGEKLSGSLNFEFDLEQAQKAYKKIIYEIELILLNEAANLASWDVRYDFWKLIEGGYIKQVIDKKAQQCMPYWQQHIDLLKEKNILKLANKLKNIPLESRFCLMFWRAVDEGFVDIKDGYLYFPFAREGERRGYYRDEDFGDRFPYLYSDED